MSEVKQSRQSLLDGIADNWAPNQIRDLAASLLKLADSVDQDWKPPENQSIFRWPNALGQIERNAVNLAAKARLLYARRRMRSKLISSSLLGEPAWDMLLELFMQWAGGAKVSTTSLCIASDCPPTTALRHISVLEKEGLVQRSSGKTDKRVVFVELTKDGVMAMGKYLEQH